MSFNNLFFGLNRCFLLEDLRKYTKCTLDELKNEEIMYERKRAQELNMMLGPKGSMESTDLIIDLHTTTSNTRINMIMSPKDQVTTVLSN